MDDLIRQGVIVLRGVWRRRWIGLAAAWLVGVVGLLVAALIPDKFDATARIYVNTQSILKPLMTGLAVQPNVDQQVAMLSRTLLRRSHVEELIRKAGFDVNLDSKSRNALVDDVTRRLEIRGEGEGRDLYTLSFRDTNPARAQRVVETLASIFVESNRSASRSESAEARGFIEGQIKSYEKKLEDAENRLKEFKLRHLGQSDGGQGYFVKLNEVTARLKEARLALREAENSRDALKRQIAGEAPKLVVSEIDARIDSLRRNLDSLLQRFTEQHPDVIGTRRVIAGLEAQRRRDLAARDRAPSESAMTSANVNPVYQEIKVALAKEEANVASLSARVAEYTKTYEELNASGRQIPEVEAELAQLNRDYEINKKNYEALVTRRESAQITGEMDAAGVGDFRVIDPPRVSSKPVAPNRLLLVPLVLVGALGAGGFASYAATRVWPTFLDGASLREVTGLPVLGSVSFRSTEEGRKSARRGLIGFLSALGGLIAVHSAAIVLLLLLSVRSV